MNREDLGRYGAAALFLFTGTMHFVAAPAFVSIVPPWLPAPAALVAISGAAELAGAIGLLLPATRSAAVWGLVALLIAVFPANINMAIDHDRYASIPAWLLWVRLPLQVLLIGWILSFRPTTVASSSRAADII